jgi:hypothetical protein
MRKPSEKDMFVVVFSDSAQKIIDAAFSSRDPLFALKQLTKLLRGRVILRCEPVKYSTATDRPLFFRWRPFAKWDGRLWLDFSANGLNLPKDKPLYKPLLRFMPSEKVRILDVSTKRFVVRHVPLRLEVNIPTGRTIPAHIHFVQVD